MKAKRRVCVPHFSSVDSMVVLYEGEYEIEKWEFKECERLVIESGPDPVELLRRIDDAWFSTKKESGLKLESAMEDSHEYLAAIGEE